MTRKIKLGWCDDEFFITKDNEFREFFTEGIEIKRDIVGSNLIRCIILGGKINTFLTTGGGDTWMYHGFIADAKSVMDSFSSDNWIWVRDFNP